MRHVGTWVEVLKSEWLLYWNVPYEKTVSWPNGRRWVRYWMRVG